MPRPSPERLELDAYPFKVEITTRFGDMDALRHLNNVALAGLYEDARVRFGTVAVDISALRDRGCRVLVGEVTISYLAEGSYPEPVTAAVGLLRLGTSSYTLGQALFQGARCLGVCESVFVYVKADEGRSRPLPEALRSALEAHRIRGGEPPA